MKDLSLEGQIVRFRMIAYTTSDINDAIRADILKLNSIPEYIINFIGSKHSERVNTLVTNVIENSVDCSHQETDDPWIRMSDDLIEIITELRNFMFEKVYLPVSDSKPAKSAMKIVDIILSFKKLEKIPNHLIEICNNNIEKASIDYITE